MLCLINSITSCPRSDECDLAEACLDGAEKVRKWFGPKGPQMSTEQITIRLPIERVAALRAAAKAETRSLAQQVEHLLKQTDPGLRSKALETTTVKGVAD
jgi:hypothetical protein